MHENGREDDDLLVRVREEAVVGALNEVDRCTLDPRFAEGIDQVWSRQWCEYESAKDEVGWSRVVQVCRHEATSCLKCEADLDRFSITHNAQLDGVADELRRRQVAHADALAVPKEDAAVVRDTDAVDVRDDVVLTERRVCVVQLGDGHDDDTGLVLTEAEVLLK